MDTFMDKLAQRFSAQEMIRANSAAEVEEMNKLKAQVESYTQCLNRMQQICAELEQTAEVAKGKVDAAQLHTDELKAQLLDIRREMQGSGGGGNADVSEDLAEMIDQLRRSQESRFESMQSAQKAQIESMQGAQQEQLENIRSSLESQIHGLKTDQELQFNGVRGMQEDQLESIRGLQGNQLEGLRGLQEEQLAAMRNSVEDQLDSVRSMIKAQISSIRSGQDGELANLRSAIELQNTNLNTAIETQLNEMKSTLETHLDGSNDFIHKECVKVYRNVQAVVGEENAKQSENLDFTIKPMEKKMKTLFKVSLMAMIFSIASVALQILQVLGLLKF